MDVWLYVPGLIRLISVNRSYMKPQSGPRETHLSKSNIQSHLFPVFAVCIRTCTMATKVNIMVMHVTTGISLQSNGHFHLHCERGSLNNDLSFHALDQLTSRLQSTRDKDRWGSIAAETALILIPQLDVAWLRPHKYFRSISISLQY